MTPERIANLVARWARVYTWGLPTDVARRRVEEIDADVHDHIAHERDRGTPDPRIARSLLSRMLRGVPADASWRRQHLPAHRAVVRVLLVTALLLSIPLIAMQLGDDVVWNPFDFAVAGVLLAGTGLAYEWLARRGIGTYRLAAALGLGSALMLVWVSLAVGVLGAEGNSADLMYVAVLATGLIGALTARFQPAGMARTLVAMAIAQSLVAAIALMTVDHDAPGSSIPDILAINAFFATLFLTSALLFHHAARSQPDPGAALRP